MAEAYTSPGDLQRRVAAIFDSRVGLLGPVSRDNESVSEATTWDRLDLTPLSRHTMATIEDGDFRFRERKTLMPAG